MTFGNLNGHKIHAFPVTFTYNSPLVYSFQRQQHDSEMPLRIKSYDKKRKLPVQARGLDIDQDKFKYLRMRITERGRMVNMDEC